MKFFSKLILPAITTASVVFASPTTKVERDTSAACCQGDIHNIDCNAYYQQCMVDFNSDDIYCGQYYQGCVDWCASPQSACPASKFKRAEGHTIFVEREEGIAQDWGDVNLYNNAECHGDSLDDGPGVGNYYEALGDNVNGFNIYNGEGCWYAYDSVDSNGFCSGLQFGELIPASCMSRDRQVGNRNLKIACLRWDRVHCLQTPPPKA